MAYRLVVLGFSLLVISETTLAGAASASASEILDCCHHLDIGLPNRVMYTGTAYDEANIRWSTTAMLHPSCIVRPRKTAEVSKAVMILTAGAQAAGKIYSCPFAIKREQIDNGITMGLRNINETTLSADKASVTFGTGSDWLSIYTALGGTGVGVPGGRHGRVGVGGIVLGGGLSFVSPKVGWVTDNVLSFEVHALKGGSSNFGIVTRAKLQTFPSDGKFWGGSVAHPHTTNTTSLVLSALNNFTTNNHRDENAAFNSNFIYNATSRTKNIANTIVYSEDIANASIFDQAQSIQPQLANTAKSTTIVELAANTASLPYGYRYGGATVTFKNTVEALAVAQNITDSIYETVANVTDLVFTFVYEPIPSLYAEHSIARGGNVMGMKNTRDDLILLLLVPRWTDAKDDSAMRAAFVFWVGAMEKAQTRLGAHHNFTYLNYAAASQNPLGSYSAANVEFMRKVAKTYDPHGVFQTVVPGGFKISEVKGGEWRQGW
ncbi:Uu.00g026700.m01.CDS01 [Anthostomella pinea]|uniref:Uu.00g026700.m01.CDS01 n=1 Tax=Anthostomella pinea TaxID=933095 RepID=A0AAI8YCM2_9PEZI|nr:Uu.00g026700.m01.CDS01 [Anthostomella pinea]